MSDRRLTRRELARKNKIQNNKRKAIQVAIILSITTIILYVTNISGASLAYLGDFISNAKVLVQFGDGWPYEKEIVGYKQSEAMGNSLAFLDKDCVEIFSPTAKKVFTYQHTMSNPILTTSDNRCVVYNQGTTSFQVLNSYKILFAKEMQNEIINIDISDNNKMAVLTTSLNYNSEITFFDNNMKEKFVWYCANGYPVYNKISPKGNNLAVTALTTNDGMSASIVYLIDTKKGQEIFRIESSNYPLDIKYINEDNILIFYENSIQLWDINNQSMVNEYSFDNDELITYTTDSKYIIIALGGHERESGNKIVVLSNTLQEQFTINIDDIINDVAFYQSRIYIMSNDLIYEYNLKGENLAIIEDIINMKEFIKFGGILTVTSNGIYKVEKS